MALQTNQMSVHEILEMIFQNKLLFIACTLLGLLVAYVIVYNTDKWYDSRADIQVVDRNANEPLLKGLGVTTSMHQRFRTVRARLLSRGSLEKLIQDLRSMPKYKNKLYDLARGDAGDTAKTLQVEMGVTGGIIYVRCERRHPDEAWAVVDYMKDKMQDELVGFSENRLKDTRAVLQDLSNKYGRKLAEAEEVLRDFQIINQMDLVGTTPEEMSDVVSQLGAGSGPRSVVSQFVNLYEQHSQNEIQLQAMLAKHQSILQQIAAEPAFEVTGVTLEPSTENQTVRTQLAKAEAELESLQKTCSEMHPFVQEKKDEVASLRRQAERSEDQVVREQKKSANPVLSKLRLEASTLEADIEALEQEQVRLMAQIDKMKERVKNIPRLELDKTRLRRETKILAQTYQDIRQRYAKAELTHEMEKQDRQEYFLVLGQASHNTTPIRPNRKFMYIMGVFLGMVLGILACVVREITNTSFRNLDDASRFLDLPILGVIPEVPDRPVKRRRRKRSSRHPRTPDRALSNRKRYAAS